MLCLKEIRTSKGKTQEEVSAAIGYSRASYANIENGKRVPDAYLILALAEYFRVSTDEIYGRRVETTTAASDLSPSQSEILEIFNQLNEAGKALMLQQSVALLHEPALRQESAIASGH